MFDNADIKAVHEKSIRRQMCEYLEEISFEIEFWVPDINVTYQFRKDHTSELYAWFWV